MKLINKGGSNKARRLEKNRKINKQRGTFIWHLRVGSEKPIGKDRDNHEDTFGVSSFTKSMRMYKEVVYAAIAFSTKSTSIESR